MKSCIQQTDSYPQHKISYSRLIPTQTGTTPYIVTVTNDFYHVVATANIRMDRMARLVENISVGKAKNLDKYRTNQFTELLSVASESP